MQLAPSAGPWNIETPQWEGAAGPTQYRFVREALAILKIEVYHSAHPLRRALLLEGGRAVVVMLSAPPNIPYIIIAKWCWRRELPGHPATKGCIVVEALAIYRLKLLLL